jgi:hypothetical protein
MRPDQSASVEFKAIANDALAGGAQLIADVQRFGLRLLDFRMVANAQGGAAIQFGLAAASGCDTTVLRARFARHPSLISVELLEPSSSDHLSAAT